ncbi:MAG: TraB/GumN family protein [Deltaproteobacteria bacterium]|jgi:uncharacterized protein YbaP (TraB family)|nr:TraB/GumN family protein [Deltaproteobacteria bacterium]
MPVNCGGLNTAKAGTVPASFAWLRGRAALAAALALMAAALLSAAASPFPAFGQPAEAMPEPALEGGRHEALMWRATSPEGRELYLLGSLHMARTSFYPLKDVLYKAFDRAGTLVLELDPGSEDLGETLNILTSKGFYQDGETLAEHLDPEVSAMMGPFLEFLPGGADATMKPWLAAVTLSVALLEKNGYLIKEGVDRHFLAMARERGMEFVELESPSEQLGIFADMPESESLLFLKASLLELKDLERFMDEMVDSWKNGDAGRFEEAFFATYRQWPELAPLLDKVIFNRNRTMFERLQPLLESSSKPVFAVIGSGHLVGPRGIPSLFAAAGWKLEQF